MSWHLDYRLFKIAICVRTTPTKQSREQHQRGSHPSVDGAEAFVLASLPYPIPPTPESPVPHPLVVLPAANDLLYGGPDENGLRDGRSAGAQRLSAGQLADVGWLGWGGHSHARTGPCTSPSYPPAAGTTRRSRLRRGCLAVGTVSFLPLLLTKRHRKKRRTPSRYLSWPRRSR